MAESHLEIIESELIKCAKRLISFYKPGPEDALEVEHTSMPYAADETLFCSSIGLAGAEFKLSVVILATSETVAALCPIEDISTEDWIGELANQLIGRLKNALIEYGHSGQITLPTTFSGSSLSVWDKTSSPITSIVKTDAGRIVFRLEADVNPDSVWERNEAPAEEAEGTLCLF